MKKLTLIILALTLTGFAFTQSVEVKDSDGNTLITVNDEGTAKSSITVQESASAPGSTAFLPR